MYFFKNFPFFIFLLNIVTSEIGFCQIIKEYEDDQVLVKYFEEDSYKKMDNIRKTIKANVLRRYTIINAELWQLKEMSIEEAIEQIKRNPLIEFAEPNYRVYAIGLSPNDPRFDELWNMNNNGQTGGSDDSDIDAPEAWEICTGGDVLVGVIDTGIDYGHVDLSGNMWINPYEIRDNGIDDDNNGYIDDVYGWDFINNDNDPMDDHSHGTHCAGTIGAIGNNSLGVVGANWSPKLMALKFLSADGSGNIADAILAIQYAIQMGAQLTNNSWGGGGYSQSLYDAIEAAGQAGQLFIAAAGNDYGNNNDINPHYPSNYDLECIIAVAATDHNDELAGFSNIGPTSVDLGAPGVEILSTIPGNEYGLKSGTSMATPLVSGVASLIWAHAPNLSKDEVKLKIMNSVDPLISLQGKCITGGRLNAYGALIFDPDNIPDIVVNPTLMNESLQTGLTSRQILTIKNEGEGELVFSLPNFVTSNLMESFYVNKKQDYNSIERIELSKEQSDTRIGNPVLLSVGGPDEFGYQWIDSHETGGPSFEWFDISSIGTPSELTGDDDFVSLNLPFDFNFYGINQSLVNISTDGYITFGNDGTDFSNDPIPTDTDPNNLIAPFWDDLHQREGINYYYYDSDNERFIIQYSNWGRYSGDGDYTFQVHLYKDGAIYFYYYTMSGVLNGATIGIENIDASIGLEVAFNQDYLENNLAVQIVPSPQYLSVNPSNGTLASGQSINLEVTFNASTLPAGTYSQFIQISSNDPDQRNLIVPTQLDVFDASLPEISDLCASVSGISVLLEWTGLSEAIGYRIYRGTSYNFTPEGNNCIADGIQDQDSDTPGVQWLDSGDSVQLTGDVNTNYFWRVVAIISNEPSVTESSPSNVAGEFDYPLITTATTNINEIVVSMNTSGSREPITDAEELGLAVPNCTVVYQWDVNGQGSIGHPVGFSFSNFDVSAGMPYMVNVETDGVWTIAGILPDIHFGLVTTQGTDINHICLPYTMDYLTSAEELGQSISDCSVVYKWDTEGQGTVGHPVGFSFGNFDIRTGSPYYVNVTANSVWPDTSVSGLMKEVRPDCFNSAKQSVTLAGGIPHLIFGRYKIDSQVSDLAQAKFELSVWVNDRPDEILTNFDTDSLSKSVGTDMDKEYWWSNTGNLLTPWAVGDEIEIKIEEQLLGLIGEGHLILTANGTDTSDVIILRDKVQVVGFHQDTFLPEAFELGNNYPNPFNPTTTIPYCLPKKADVVIQIYDITGALVNTLYSGEKEAGYHKIVWDGTNHQRNQVVSGVYFYKLHTGDYTSIKKMMFVK